MSTLAMLFEPVIQWRVKLPQSKCENAGITSSEYMKGGGWAELNFTWFDWKRGTEAEYLGDILEIGGDDNGGDRNVGCMKWKM